MSTQYDGFDHLRDFMAMQRVSLTEWAKFVQTGPSRPRWQR